MSETSVYESAAYDGLRPEPAMTVSEWADRHRILSQRASAEPGRWRTDRTPYLREIQDALSASSPVEQVVMMKGAQIGGTEAGNNWLAYVIDHAPGPMMAVSPTVEMAKRNSRHRIEPLIDDCPRLRRKVSQPRDREGSSTVLSKSFPGGVLVLTGANSAVGLRSMPVRYLFLDEIDGYPADLDGEGSPLELALARTRTFARRKVLMVSTPTITGQSRIEAAFEESDQRYFEVPCPECEAMQALRWSNLRWEEDRPETAAYACEACGALIEEHRKTEMLAAGRWIPRNPDAPSHLRGYHISALYSPVGWFSWAEAARMFTRAKKSPESLRVFVNTVLGETWKERGEAPDWKRLYRRREEYRAGTVPAGGLVLTAGVDVQRDRLELEVVAWGRDRMSWSVDYVVIDGDPAGERVWRDLDRQLDRAFDHELGGSLSIRRLAIDAGFMTAAVYSWARGKPRVMPVKGSPTSQTLVGSPHRVDVTRDGRKIRRGARSWPVGVSMAKSELYAWLAHEEPIEDEDVPPGYCHFPSDYGVDYFKQLTAEELQSRVVRGFRRYDWVKIRERNEALDCRVYARAAAAVVGIERMKDPDWEQIENELRTEATRPKADRRKRRRRVSANEWLGLDPRRTGSWLA